VERFLSSGDAIDWHAPAVKDLAHRLASGRTRPEDVVRACYQWVRDRIPHTSDHQLEPVSCSASEVLAHGTGFCYAKSHLLAALLRANGLPAGLVYQRLGNEGAYCLHGLNAVWLEGVGWYRLDARGSRADLVSEFTPPVECLPFSASEPGERLFPGVWAEPVPVVTRALRACIRSSDLLNALPDAEDLGLPDAVTCATLRT
jgi:transglutaminase-like putative cysteine protease